MAELADALDLGSSAFRRAGSIPVTRTKKIPVGINPTGFIFLLLYELGFLLAFCEEDFSVCLSTENKSNY